MFGGKAPQRCLYALLKVAAIGVIFAAVTVYQTRNHVTHVTPDFTLQISADAEHELATRSCSVNAPFHVRTASARSQRTTA